MRTIYIIKAIEKKLMSLLRVIIFSILFTSSYFSKAQIILDKSSNDKTLSTCRDFFYDSGGESGMYSNNEDYTITIQSSEKKQLQIDFFKFELEAGKDKLYIYDGNSIQSPLIAVLTGNNIPSNIISSGIYLTFRFISDSANTESGWAAHMDCYTPSDNNPQSHSKNIVVSNNAPYNSADYLVKNVLITGCLTATNVTYKTSDADGNQNTLQFGYFDAAACTVLGLTKGIVMATGNIGSPSCPNHIITGPNDMPGAMCANNNVIVTDADLNKLCKGCQFYDVCIIEFDFKPVGNVMQFKYVFASEEYPEYVCSQYNDVFGFFLTGPNPAGGNYTSQNIATVPGKPDIPVAINTINRGTSGGQGQDANCTKMDPTWTTNSAYYKGNGNGQPDLQFDGLTVPLTAQANVVPCQTYHIKLAIADVGDGSYDSGVFLEANSFNAGSITLKASPDTICLGSSSVITVSGGNSYTWNTGQTSSSITVSPTVKTTYSVTGTSACAGCTATSSITVNVKPCSPFINVNSGSVCAGNCIILNSSALGGNPPYTYTWSPATGLSGTTGTTVTACPAITTTYTVRLKDNLNATATANAVVTVNPIPNVTSTGGTICHGTSINIIAGGATTYTWNTGATNNTYNVSPTQTTTYTVTGNANGCTSTASCVVVVNPLPTISATGGTVCNGSSQQICASGGATYTWNNGLGAGQCKTVTPSATTTYIVTGTDANGCTGTASCVVIVNNNITPTVNNPTICLGVIATLTASGGDNYTWTPGGQTGSTITVNPVTTTTYLVNATNAFGCTGTVVAKVTVNQLPNITATGGIICSGSSININASNGTTYTWNTSSNNNPYNVTPNTTTTYTVTGTDGNGCTNTALCMVNVNPNPTVTATNGSVCNGSSATICASGSNTYSWNNSITTSCQTQAPTVTTIYYVTGTDANGCKGTASATIVVSTNLTMNVTGATICNGATATICAANGNTYTWNTGQQGSCISVSPNTTTIYSVSGTHVNGCTGTATVLVSVNPLPNVTATGGTICIGASINISANGAATYNWNNGTTTQTQVVAPKITTTYFTTGTDANGCTSTASCIVIVNPLPVVTATGGSMCENSSIVISASGATSYIWDNGLGAGNPKTVSPKQTTTYLVTGTDNNTCSNTASCVVCVNSALVLNVSPNEMCSGGTATVCVSNGTNYTWSTGENTPCITVSPINTTSYYVTGTNSNGCTGISFAVVNVNQLPSVSAVNKTICYGITTTLTATGSGGTPPYNYQWASVTSPATGATVSVSPLVNTTYSITVTDNKGCTATTTVSVIVSPQMFAGITKTDATCGLPNASAQVTGTGGIPIISGAPYTYLWSPGSHTTNIISNIVSGTYNVTVTDAVGCIATASVVITDTPPVTLSTSSTPTNCFANGTATVNVLTGTPSYTYTWSTLPPQNTQVATNINSGLYTVTVVDNKGCSNIASVIVNENNPLSVIISSAPEHCGQMDGTATVNASGGYTTLYTYIWDNGATMQTITNLAQGSYVVTVSYGTCKISGAATVLEKLGPKADFTYSPAVLDIFENTTALFDDLSTPGGQSIVRWYWDFGDENSTSDIKLPTHTYKNVGTYTVCLRVTDSENCRDSICKPIIVKDIFTVYIPNAFSPNEDMLNEVFIPQGYNIDPAEFQMMIFDRWGEMIYKTTDINIPWNGRYFNTGEVVQVGVYVYRIIAKEKDGPQHEFIGRVSVIK
ncbi:MAG: choice-of-anchor L domain-containing protein [Bacteroidales bacterium]|nr:choice-of-anchor L domain-containing protein [Bacteroidales bacterium]